MPKIVGRNERGFVDPLSLFGLLFLVVTLAAVTFVTTNKNISLNISEKAAKLGKTGNSAFDKCREESGREVCNERLGTNVNWKGEIVNEIDTSNVNKAAPQGQPTCDANGVQYSPGAVVMYGGIGSNATCGSDGKWDVGVGATTDIKPENVPEYAKEAVEKEKAIEAEKQLTEQVAVPTTVTVEPEQIGLTQSTNQTSGTTVVQQPAVTAVTTAVPSTPKPVTSTSSSCGGCSVNETCVSIGYGYYGCQANSTLTQVTAAPVTPITTTTQVGQPCTNCHLSPTQQTQNSVQLPSQQTVAQVINLMNKDNPVPPTTHYAVIDNKLVTGTVETNSPPDNNYGSCNGDPTCNSALTSIDRGMNAISFGGWSNYTEAYSPDKVKYTWQESGYKSVKECQDDMIAKNNNAQAAASCNTYQITKEQAISSIKLGTTLTAEAAVIIALPGAIAAGGTAITAGATTLQVGGAVLAPALTSFGAITTLTQTSAAAVAQITDPGSPEAWKQTGYAALSWLNIGTADKLIRSFGALDAAKKAGQATETLVTAAQSARNLNNVVSGINLAVDVPNAVSTCSQAGFFTGSCGGALAAVGADIVFGTVDYKQGQLGFGNPLTKVNEGALIGPLPDIKDPNGTRIATPAEINQINQLIANPFGTTPSISNVDGEVKFTPSRQLDMFDQLARDPVANTSTVVNNGTELIFPNKPASQNPNANFDLTKTDSNEGSAIAAFNSTDINTQGGTVAQLTPSNLNSQIPNSPEDLTPNPQKFTNWVKDEMAKTNPNAFKNIGFELRSPIGTDGKLQLPFGKPAVPVSEIPVEIDLNKLEVKDVPSWENVKNKEVATVIDVENINSVPPLKGRDFTPQVKPVRELYPVEIVNNLFFSEESADSGRKLVQDYLQALKNGEDVSEYQKIAKSFLNAQEKAYDTQLQSANSELADRISRNYKGVDVNSLPTENIDDLALVRVMSSPDPIGVDPYGNVVIQSTFLGNPQKDAESLYRTSKHFTVNGAVAPVKTAYGGVADWSAGDVVVITPMNEFVKINGSPNTFAVQDTWWTPGTYDNLTLPKGTVLIIKDGSEALKEYANLPGVLIIKSENPYRSSREVLEQLGYQYKAQGTEFSHADSGSPEEFLNEYVFAYKLGADTGLHFDSPTMRVGGQIAATYIENEIVNNMTAWGKGGISERQRLNTVINLIQKGYFSDKPINGLYIPPERLSWVQDLSLSNFEWTTSPLTRSQKAAVDNMINIEKLTLPSYWENQGIVTQYQKLIKDSFVDPTLASGLPLLKPDIFGLTNEDTNFLRQNVNELTKTTIPVSSETILQQDSANVAIYEGDVAQTAAEAKPNLFGLGWNGFTNSEGKFTLWPLEKITTPNPPIKSGEVFDPNIEIKNILKSPNRTEALADFKTKLAYQQKGIAKIQTELEKTILSNPAVTFDELTSQVNSLSKTYGLSNTQMGKLEDALTIYQERTTRISELLSDYPDKNDLFEAMFGKKPVGRIEISRGPISIHIKTYNTEDYEYMWNYDLTDPAIPTNTNAANTSGGFFMPSGTLLPDTEGIIIVENNTKWYAKFFGPDIVGIHEDQHALNNLLKQADIYPAPLSGYSDSYYNLQQALVLGDNQLINTSLQNYLDRVKTSANYDMTDEMLAMLKDGTSNSTITKYITQPKNNGGIYDFYAWRKEDVTKIFNTEDLAANKSIQYIIDQNLGTNASKTVINNGLKSFDNLLSKGYTRDEALALLEKTALSDWPKVSERSATPNFITRTTSYISGKIVTPRNLASFQTPSNYLMAGGIIYQVYNINKIVNLASNFGWDNTGALLKDWWQDHNPFSSTLPTSETPTGDEKVSESSLINVVNPPPAIPPIIPDSPAKTNEQQKLELERQAKIKSGLYAQIDADLATQTILGGAGKPFKNIGCGQVAVANILCEYGNYCPTPIQIANQIPLEDYGTTGLTSSQSNIKILNENGFTTDPYTKSLQYHLTDYMEPTDVLWISGIVGGIDHHTYIDGYTLDKNGVAIYNLNDSYFGDGYKCKTSGDSSFSCDNPDGSHINIGAENANIYIIDTNI